MNAKELRDWIDSLTQDITFEYAGVSGSICPFTRTNISVSFGDKERTFHSVNDVMEKPFIAGKALKDICGKIKFE